MNRGFDRLQWLRSVREIKKQHHSLFLNAFPRYNFIIVGPSISLFEAGSLSVAVTLTLHSIFEACACASHSIYPGCTMLLSMMTLSDFS